jgi:hypothetical protein
MLVEGDRYWLSYGWTSREMPQVKTDDGVLLPWFEIGCDGIDTYLVRTTDAVVTSRGLKPRVYITPGRTVPVEELNDFAHLLWLAYAVGRVDSDGGLGGLYPGRGLAGRAMPVQDLRAELRVDDRISSRVGLIRWFAPGYIIDIAQTSRLSSGAGLPSKLRRAPPYHNGFLFAEYRVMDKAIVDGVGIPISVELNTYRPVLGGETAEDLERTGVVAVSVKQYLERDLSAYDFRPSLPLNAIIHDRRIQRADGKDVIYSSNGPRWPKRTDAFVIKTAQKYAALPKLMERLKYKRYGIYVSFVALTGLFLLKASQLVKNNAKKTHEKSN